MTEVNTVEPTAVENTVEESDLLRSIKADPMETERQLLKLRHENAQKLNNASKEDYERLKKIEAEYSLEQEKTLKEQGEYKTLLEKKEAELAELVGVSEINAKHEEYFKVQLEDELKTMTEGMAKIVSESGKDIASQLQMAKQLKSEMGVGVNSPSADRPSAQASTGDVTTLAETIKTETDMLKKSKMIYELKSKTDAFSKQVLDLIKT